MIILHVTYFLKPTVKRKDFCTELEEKKIISKTREEDGCVAYRFFYPVDAENQVFLLEIWETAEKMAAHKQSEQFRELQMSKLRYVKNTAVNQFES